MKKQMLTFKPLTIAIWAAIYGVENPHVRYMILWNYQAMQS